MFHLLLQRHCRESQWRSRMTTATSAPDANVTIVIERIQSAKP